MVKLAMRVRGTTALASHVFGPQARLHCRRVLLVEVSREKDRFARENVARVFELRRHAAKRVGLLVSDAVANQWNFPCLHVRAQHVEAAPAGVS